MRCVLLAIILLGSALTTPANARDRLSMRVLPAVAFAPANLYIRAEVAADDSHRAIEIVAESDEFYRSSQIQLNGARAPRITTIEFRSVPGGTYEVRATLKDADGDSLATTQVSINVVESAAGR